MPKIESISARIPPGVYHRAAAIALKGETRSREIGNRYTHPLGEVGLSEALREARLSEAATPTTAARHLRIANGRVILRSASCGRPTGPTRIRQQHTRCAEVVELADALDSGSSGS